MASSFAAAAPLPLFYYDAIYKSSTRPITGQIRFDLIVPPSNAVKHFGEAVERDFAWWQTSLQSGHQRLQQRHLAAIITANEHEETREQTLIQRTLPDFNNQVLASALAKNEMIPTAATTTTSVTSTTDQDGSCFTLATFPFETIKALSNFLRSNSDILKRDILAMLSKKERRCLEQLNFDLNELLPGNGCWSGSFLWRASSLPRIATLCGTLAALSQGLVNRHCPEIKTVFSCLHLALSLFPMELCDPLSLCENRSPLVKVVYQCS